MSGPERAREKHRRLSEAVARALGAAPGERETVLRDAWNFTGYVTSDSGAVADILKHHHYTSDCTVAVRSRS